MSLPWYKHLLCFILALQKAFHISYLQLLNLNLIING